jgi:hypothetical protein
VKWLQQRHDWPGLKSVVMVESSREIAGKATRQMRFYVCSLTLPANVIGPMIRYHWAIENSLHWISAPAPSEPLARELQENIYSSCSSSFPWLHSLKSWGLRQSRRGSAVLPESRRQRAQSGARLRIGQR